VTEARNRHDEEFGEDRLLECLRANRQAAPDDLLRRVFATVREFCDGADATDDITVTVTRVGATDPPGDQPTDEPLAATSGR